LVLVAAYQIMDVRWQHKTGQLIKSIAADRIKIRFAHF